MSRYSPRVLDASALIVMFAGHPVLMNMLDDAEDDNVVMIMPTLAIAEAEAVLGAGMAIWRHFLGFRGLNGMELTDNTAIESGRIRRLRGHAGVQYAEPMTPMMIAQVVYESTAAKAPVVTQFRSAYQGHNVAIMAV